MKYMGSKRRISKEILPIILENRRTGQYYVEPFVGGCNCIENVSDERIGCDNNFYLISLYKELQNGWIPPENVTEEMYNYIRINKENVSPWLVGYVGFSLSYGGKFFGGYRRDKIGKRNYSLEAYKDVMKMRDKIIGVEFYCCSYLDLWIPDNSIVYCDPPYFGTTKYSSDFNHKLFWKWCRMQKVLGHVVYISEYIAPSDFSCVWEKEVNNTLVKDTGSKRGIERLFTL